MRRFHRLAILLAVASSVTMGQSNGSPIDAAAWLAGCWRSDGREKGSGEHWMQPAGGTMLGVSRAVKGGKTIAHEFMQIRIDVAGRLVFVARPSGQSEATFALSTQTDTLLVFENPAHDFPQRISYQALSGSRLLVRIEGVRSEVKGAVEFPMTRVSCQDL